MISVNTILDSISNDGVRLTSIEMVLPRIILPELNTHRMFSRNYSSTRAIPTRKLIEQVRTAPFVPTRIGKNRSGMQATEWFEGEELEKAQAMWIRSANRAADEAEEMVNFGVHKQTVGRIIEPYMYVRGVVTSTNWNNFLTLRDHPDAQPEILELAQCVRGVLAISTPKLLNDGEWHLPYVSDEDRQALNHDLRAMISVSAARCARTSYKTHHGVTSTLQDDYELCEKLNTYPLHASPFEHQATPDTKVDGRHWREPNFHGNLTGWKQWRKLMPSEYSKEDWEK